MDLYSRAMLEKRCLYEATLGNVTWHKPYKPNCYDFGHGYPLGGQGLIRVCACHIKIRRMARVSISAISSKLVLAIARRVNA